MLLSFRSLARLLPLLLISFVSFTACDGDDDGLAVIGGPDDPNAAPRLTIRLTDAPADYERVLIDIREVRVKFAGEEDRTLDEQFTGQIDLLELTAGIDTLIASSVVPTAELEEVRLILGDDNFVQVDGELIRMRTPSAQQSGLKVKFNNSPTFQTGSAYVVLLDFDAGRSVVRAGNSGNYNLKPVIRASLEEVGLDPTTARIQGIVQPALGQYVTAINPGVDTFGTFSGTTGVFTFLNVPPAVYTVTVVSADSSVVSDFIQTDVITTAGELTDLGVLRVQ